MEFKNSNYLTLEIKRCPAQQTKSYFEQSLLNQIAMVVLIRVKKNKRRAYL